MVGRKAPEETRREDMLRAAYDVVARQGLEALTLRTVAARAEAVIDPKGFDVRQHFAAAAQMTERLSVVNPAP